MRVVHLVFAVLWVGATVYFTFGVVPAARDGLGEPEVYQKLSSRFTVFSVVSVIILFLTGGHLAGTLYTFEALLNTTSGNLVLSMLALWFVLAGVLHVATKKFDGGLEEGRLRQPAESAFPWYIVGSVLGVSLLLNAVAFRLY